MKNYFIKRIFSFIVFIGLLAIISTKSVLASQQVFFDDFNNASASAAQWITSGPQLFNGDGSQANWTFENGSYGMRIVNHGSQFNETIPKNWDQSIKNYIYEVDMKLLNGVDTNLVFRYRDHNNWYGIHGINNENKLVLQKAGGVWSTTPPEKSYHFNLGEWYHFRIEVKGENIKVSINNTLIWDIVDVNTTLVEGSPGLQASTGATTSVEVWFDNIVVTSIDNTLPVPYFSQNDLPWGPTEYDHAQSLGIHNPTMDRWGCKVTSTAMILNYHGMTQFADGTPINPGTLNDWLNNNNGYLTGIGKDGPYSYIDMSKIPTLTKELYEANKSAVKLEYNSFDTIDATATATLNDDLLVKKIPDILRVQNASTSSHFVVATGINNNIYSINDPEWKVPDLSSFNNSFTRIDRLVPSHTNLSFITIVTNPSVDIVITDPQGRKTGRQYEKYGFITEFKEIPNATYNFEAPISNLNSLGKQENLGTGVNVFMLPKPDDGNYQIAASSKNDQEYTINISTMDVNGNNALVKSLGTVSSGKDDAFGLSYSQSTATSSAKRSVTFDSTIQDIKEAQTLGLINNILAKTLILTIKNADKQANNGHKQIALIELTAAQVLLDEGKKLNLVDKNEYEILAYDLNYLKTNL